MADAMKYEFLLRRIYQVGRFGKKDVDADVFRTFENAEALYKQELRNKKNGEPSLNVGSLDKLENDYRVQCFRIWNILSKSINDAISIYSSILSNDEVKTLQSFTVNKTKVTREDIDVAIDTAQEIFIEHKIYPQ